MVTINTFRQLALSFPETTEHPHFEKTSFRVRKRIFATYDSKTNLASIKLSEREQDIFSTFNKSIVWPVPNKWGKQGWTLLDLATIPTEMFIDALTMAYRTVAPATLADRPAQE